MRRAGFLGLDKAPRPRTRPPGQEANAPTITAGSLGKSRLLVKDGYARETAAAPSLDRLHLPRACRTLRQGLQYSHSNGSANMICMVSSARAPSHRCTGVSTEACVEVVAVKQIVRAKLNRKLQENLEAEISILQSIEHPNVMRLHEVQTTERHVYLMLEFCPGGDLMHVIKKHGAQSEAQTRVYLVQLAHGLQHLRQRNLIHRDLPQNLLLSNHHPHGELKIGDFGFARYMQQQDLAETLCGSPLYMAPEILRYHKYDAEGRSLERRGDHV